MLPRNGLPGCSRIWALADYARRRRAVDPEGIAAEVMAIAWRRLADVPPEDPRPWLIATARNLVWADWRRQRGGAMPSRDEQHAAAVIPSRLVELDPELEAALLQLAPSDLEALLLVAWEDLTAKAAAASLGISATAFRARLHRARGRLIRHLADTEPSSSACRRTRLEETSASNPMLLTGYVTQRRPARRRQLQMNCGLRSSPRRATHGWRSRRCRGRVGAASFG